MSLPYFPMFPTDFEAKTSHLTLAEDGAYNRLLRLMWMTPGCSLPDDDAWIMRRMRVDRDTFEGIVRGVISEFCERSNGRVSNARLVRIFRENSEAHEKRVNAGSRGGKAKALNINTIEPSKAKAMLKQPEPEPEPEERDTGKPVSPEPKERLPEGWILSEDGLAYARSQNIPDEVIHDEARGFHAYWSDRRDRDSKKSARGWEQCWANRCRDIATRYRRGVAGQAKPNGYGQGSSIACIAARRRLAGQV